MITQPYEGAKREGVAGLIKGFGKGIGGVVLKPNAGRSSVSFIVFCKLTVKRFGDYRVTHSKASTKSCKSTLVLAFRTTLLQEGRPKVMRIGNDQRLKNV